MSSMASLGRMVSGLSASQRGLQVTGHNLSNMNTKGFTRQQLLQHDSAYLNIGKGLTTKQVGLGVSITEIRQVRDNFADARFRTENSTYQYYQAKQTATMEIESILDEPHGETLSGLMNDFWGQTQKLSTNPSGVEERLAFIQTADVLTKRMNQIMNGFEDYQYHLNDQVHESVDNINSLIEGIDELNDRIVEAEINGDNANDYRDQRNLLLDELSSEIDIDYTETPEGRIVINSNGRTILDHGFSLKLETEHVDNDSGFVEPVWEDTKEPVFKLHRSVNDTNSNDNGKLKALLTNRGNIKADANTSWEEIALNPNYSVDTTGNAYMIPKLQKEFSLFAQEITKVINDTLDGFGIDGEMGVPVFVPIDMPDVFPPGKTEADYLYAGNIQVNPKLLGEGGYNHLGTVSKTTDSSNIGDNSLVTELLDEWNKPRTWPGDAGTSSAAPHASETNFMDFYAEFVSDIGADGAQYQRKIKEKGTIVNSIETERQSMYAVSQDEELSNMLKYQYAYNASARMINVLDGMMDTVINQM